jgi:hypothetical protein
VTAARLAPGGFAAVLVAGCATFGSGGDNTVQALSGSWTVDLRPELDGQPYSQPMDLIVARDGSVTGSFYGSPILGGKAATGQGRSCVAFRTSDNSGPYHTSACLEGGTLVGETWSEGRDFLQPWTAERN